MSSKQINRNKLCRVDRREFKTIRFFRKRENKVSGGLGEIKRYYF